MEILPTKICVPNPVFTFAPATKMTTDAVWNGGMGISAYLLERREGKGGSSKGGATDKGKAPLSCRRDRSPATVIVMRAWLAVASFLPTAHVFKRSCLPCPVWQKHGKTV